MINLYLSYDTSCYLKKVTTLPSGKRKILNNSFCAVIREKLNGGYGTFQLEHFKLFRRKQKKGQI